MPKPHLIRLALALGFCSLLHNPANGQNLANWTLNNTLVGISGGLNAVSIIDFSPAVPIHQYNGGTEYFGEGNWPSGALNPAMYLEFTIIPLPGFQVDIHSLDMRIRRSNTGSPAGAGPNNWALRSSLDGFSNNIASGSMDYNYSDYIVTPGSTFLSQYLPVSFRLYGYNASTNPGGNSRLVVDNISVQGLGSLLPVTIGRCGASINNNTATINFTIFNTVAGTKYTAQRSTDAVNFQDIGAITETAAAAEKNYTISDRLTSTAPQQLYYRVRVSSNTMQTTYSPTVRLNQQEASTIQASVKNNVLTINGTFADAGNHQVDIYNSNGQLISQYYFYSNKGYNSEQIHVAHTLPRICAVQISYKGKMVLSKLNICE